MTILIEARRGYKGSFHIDAAAHIISHGGVVAFPTETVYGLGADALNARAVARIFAAKGRPADNPLIVHVADRKDVYALAREVPKSAELLMRKFWPGPLTLVLKKSGKVPRITTAGLDTVAIRMPANRIALALIKAAKTPIAAPSANVSGRPSPTRAEHVLLDLSGRVGAVIDGGSTKIGVESTVLDLTQKVPAVLRPGKITIEQIRRVIGRVKAHSTHHPGTARSPGMRHRHYAPQARLIVIEGKPEAVKLEARALARAYQKSGEKTAVLRPGKNLEKAGALLFHSFRDYDRQGVRVVIVEGVAKKGFGAAIMDRLERAACGNVIRV